MVSGKSALVPNRATLNIGQRHMGDENTMKDVVGRHDVSTGGAQGGGPARVPDGARTACARDAKTGAWDGLG
jgi:hypothetical protein